MKRYSYFLHSIAATALLSSAAVANPNAVGWTGVPEGIRIGCDTLPQLMDIVDAGKTSLEAWGLKFKEFYDIKDNHGEPSCIVGAIEAEVTYKAIVDLGEVTLKEGHPEHIWAVEVVVGKSDFWIMDEESAGTPI